MSQPEVQHIPGTHNSECLCSDCNGVRKAHKAAEQRRQREDTRSFATEKSVLKESMWAGESWRN